MIEVYVIPVSKDRLQSMPAEERIAFLLIGYAANQLSLIHKLLNFAVNGEEAKISAEDILRGAQTQMLVRLAIGLIFEAWRLIEKRYLSRPIALQYRTLIDEEGSAALYKLRKLMGQSNVLSAIRNDFSFHYPQENAELDCAYADAVRDEEHDQYWNLYFSRHGYNSFFMVSELTIIRAIARRIGVEDLEEAQRRVMQEAMVAASSVVEFSRAFAFAVWRRHFGEEMLAKEVLAIPDAPSLDVVWLPFFVEIDSPASRLKSSAE